ncbi:MAG TPA: hypothetical protein ENI23_02935 [bacterium]|nr:hypothetical protein [bacterium]
MGKFGGAGIEDFARVLEDEVPIGERDWSIDLAYHLAMALISLQRLEELGLDLSFNTRKLVEPSLKEAWRQLVFIRRRRLDDKVALNDILRPVTLSKQTGKVILHESRKFRPNKTKLNQRDMGASRSYNPDWQSPTSIRKKRKFRRRRFTKPLTGTARRLRGDTDAECD